MKKSSPYFLWLWALLLALGLSGLPRFIQLLAEFLTIEHDFDGYKKLFTGIVLLLHSPFLIAVLLAALFRPRTAAFTKKGIAGGIAAMGLVASGFLVLSLDKATQYPVSLLLIDTEQRPLHDVALHIERKIVGLTWTTSYRSEQARKVADGLVQLDRAKYETMIVTVTKEGFVPVMVTVYPMVSPYPRGPLQVSLMRTEDSPVLPIPEYSEADWKEIEQQASRGS